MKLQLGHNTGEVKSAEEYRRLADEHAQTLKDFWKRFAVSGLFVLALVIILFASLAWFAANNRVGGSSSAISAKAARYSISGPAEGQAGKYDGKVASLEFNDSLNVSATYNLNNFTSGGSLRPGSYGQLEVTVTPVAGDVRDITLTIERNIQLRDSADANVTTDALQNLFRGHVLFFRDKSSDGYYSDPVLDDTLTIEASEFCAEGSSTTTEPVTITLYWVWPSQFSSYVLTGQINYSKNLFSGVDSTGYTMLIEDINTNSTRYFSVKPDGISINHDMSSADLETCAEAYNTADEVLGTNAEYLQIRFLGAEKEATQ